MIWLTWRQFRVPGAIVLAAAATLGVVLAITGPALLHDSRTLTDFVDVVNRDTVTRTLYIASAVVLYALPLVVGAFWGAPLIARELDSGTHRLVFTQSVTRTRWLATKLGFTALVAAAVSGLLGLGVTGWAAPIDRAATTTDITRFFGLPRMLTLMFGVRGIAPIGYTVLALAVGVTLGLVLRRPLPALALTIAVMIAVQIAMPVLVREHLIPAEVSTVALTEDNVIGVSADPGQGGGPPVVDKLEVKRDLPGAWVISDVTVDVRTGRPITLPTWAGDCTRPPDNAPAPAGETPAGQASAGQASAGQASATQTACLARMADAGYQQQVTYHPADRFWRLQLAETGLLLAVAALLTGFCFWRIRRDLT